ncbi:MAG: ATP-binding cassette domain-containing protein, partial [Dehalococcoidia bacterium]
MTLEFEARLRLGEFQYDAAFEADAEVVVLFGHSGAGKSVTLQAVAGLVRPDSGRIVLGGQPLFDATRGIDLSPQDRGVGYVVQELALFPHLSVAENVAFGARGSRADRRARTAPLLSRLGLEGFADRMPASLSGGQQQRVALARALARDVPLLLLDEPFSALDESLRRTLRAELLRLRADLGLTVVFVTHDLREAHLLADRLAVFDQGRILQFDRRDEVFRHPAS